MTTSQQLPFAHQLALTDRKKPQWSFDSIELLLLGFVLVFYAFVWAFEGLVEFSTANIVGSIALIFVLLLSSLAALKVEQLAIWEALFWFRISCLVYYGIGSAVPYLGSGETVLYMQSLYPFSDRELLKVNTIVAMSILIVLCGSLCVPRRKKPRPATQALTSVRVASITAIAFVLIGGAARYSIVVPNLVGAEMTALSGAAAATAKLYPAGLLILLIVGLRQHISLLIFVIVLTITDLLVGILLFNKTDVIITVLFTVLAIYHARPSLVRLALGGIVSVIILHQITPLVSFGRERVVQLAETQLQITPSQRWAIASEYIRQRRTVTHVDDQFQPVLNRISYANVMTMVVTWHDQGRPGQTLGTALYFFVPRFVWPEKPIITASGRDLYSEATTLLGTSISPGLFAEAYWNWGWVGPFILLFPFGIALGVFSNFALRKMEQDNWLYLPCVLMAVGIGMRVDGHYVADVLGPTLVLSVFYICCRLTEIFASMIHRCNHAYYNTSR